MQISEFRSTRLVTSDDRLCPIHVPNNPAARDAGSSILGSGHLALQIAVTAEPDHRRRRRSAILASDRAARTSNPTRRIMMAQPTAVLP